MSAHRRPARAPNAMPRGVARGRAAAAALAVCAAAARGGAQPAGDSAGATVWVHTPAGRLKAQVHRAGADASPAPLLVVVLHGDAPSGPPSYQYTFARQAAAALAGTAPGAVVAAVLRPGYRDPAGDASDGARGRTTGDNYTPAVVDAVAAAADTLRRRYGARAVVLVGHSGGAAIAADLLGRHPGAAAGALLVSCPCDVPAWRAHMARARGPLGGLLWRGSVESLSPAALAGAVAPAARVRLVVGAADSVAPPRFSAAYAQALAARGVAAPLAVLPGLGHEILLDPAVLEQLRELARDVGAR